jgi:hypothetical protein
MPSGTSPTDPDSDDDGFLDAPATFHVSPNANISFDNCPTEPNASQLNTDAAALDNGPNVPNNDTTILFSDALGDACDADDDNDGLVLETFPVPGCPSSTAALDPLDMDTDGDHLADGWECFKGSNPASPASKVLGSGSVDGDKDRIVGIWEERGYNASDARVDSDADACHDLVEIADVDGNKNVGDPDRIAVARRALGIYSAHAAQDYVLDIDKNGVVGDPDRLFVARAALLPDWLPKSCP